MKKKLIIYISAFILLFVLGALMDYAIKTEKIERESIIHLADSVGARKMKKEEVSFLTEGNTEVLEKYNVTNKKGTLVAIIYVGKSNGYNEGLVAAYAIDVANHRIIGMKIVENNETERFMDALLANANYWLQFENKDLTKTSLEVETFTGPTPNSGNVGIVAPATSAGLQRIMQLVRKQYAQDTSFEAPSEIVLVSKEQDFSNLNQYNYVFTVEEDEVSVSVSNTYELISISHPEHEALVLNAINKDKIETYISSASLSGDVWTITIISKGFDGNLQSTATVKSDGSIQSFTTDISNETFNDAYNNKYTGGSFDPVFEAILNGDEIEIVSGASVTSRAIIAASNLLKSFIKGGFGLE